MSIPNMFVWRVWVSSVDENVLYFRWIWSCLQGSLGEIYATTTRQCGCEDSERLDTKLIPVNELHYLILCNENYTHTYIVYTRIYIYIYIIIIGIQFHIHQLYGVCMNCVVPSLLQCTWWQVSFEETFLVLLDLKCNIKELAHTNAKCKTSTEEATHTLSHAEIQRHIT